MVGRPVRENDQIDKTKMVGQAHFTHDEILTAVVEIEAIINARPLSYVSMEDMEEPLTPYVDADY